MNNLKANLQNVRSRVGRACKNAHREASEVVILAVSKRHPAERIEALYRLGQRAFGENYVQEARAKQSLLHDLDIEWHFIGPLQSNKTLVVAQNFHWVQSVDRMKILQRLSDQRPPELPALNICIQVNIDREKQKGGVMPEHLVEMAHSVQMLDHLKLRGLMAIPQQATAEHNSSGSYRRMRELFNTLLASGLDLDTLSMGMSGDLETAIMEGSSMVRVGTDLLGARN
jgi:pyridoxal phosphate enzyme (YggS family)